MSSYNSQLNNNNNENNEIIINNSNLIEDEDKNQKSKNSQIEFNQYINQLMDNMGFTKYHLILFFTNSFFLFCSGMQEIIHVILLSLIDESHNLSYYHLALMNSIEYFGYTVATIIVNIITNYISRKRAIQIVILSSLIFTGLSLTSYNYYFAAINRFFIGICMGILNILIYLNLFESVPTQIRGFISSLIQLFFPLGCFTLSFVCYFELIEGNKKLNYKILLLVPFIITCILCLFVIIFIEESPRNLFGKNEFQEGVEIMKKISNFNKDMKYMENKFNFNNIKRNYNEIELANVKRELDKENNQIQKINSNIINRSNINIENIEELLRKYKKEKNIKLKFPIQKIFQSNYNYYTILFWIIASLAGFIFNGIFFMLPATAPKINKETFLDLVLFEGMEIPSNFIASLLIENSSIGRLMILRIGFFFTFLISLMILYIGNNILEFSCLLKFFLTIPITVLIVYSSEIYDSDIRTMGVSSINFWRTISSLISPFAMSYMVINYGECSTNFIYSTFLCFCSIMSLFFNTESRGIPLDEIIKINYM